MTSKWAGQRATIEIEKDGSPVPIGIIDEPEVALNQTVQELRGAGEVTWRDLQRTEMSVDVSGTVMEWDLDTWKDLTEYDEAQDQLPTDSEVPTWTTTVTYENSDGETAAFPVQECYAEDIPVGGSREEWIGLDLNFTGKTIQDVDAESTSTA